MCHIKHGKLVEAEVTSLPASLIVVSGLRKDFLHLPRRGHVTVFSVLDQNLTFSSPPLHKREYFTLQVRIIIDVIVCGLLLALSSLTMAGTYCL